MKKIYVNNLLNSNVAISKSNQNLTCSNSSILESKSWSWMLSNKASMRLK
ncbi:hypothetical protein [Mycoplasma sp. P36-A1]